MAVQVKTANPVVKDRELASPQAGLRSNHLDGIVATDNTATVLRDALEQLRATNGRLCNLIDDYFEASKTSLGPEQWHKKNNLYKKLTESEIEHDGTVICRRVFDNIEGSIYIEKGGTTVRFRWQGVSGQSAYFIENEKEKFQISLNRENSARVYMNGDSFRRHIENHSERALSNSEKALQRRADNQYKVKMEEYNSPVAKVSRFLGSIVGARSEAPKRVEVTKPSNPELSAAELQMTNKSHYELTGSIQTISDFLEKFASLLESNSKNMDNS